MASTRHVNMQKQSKGPRSVKMGIDFVLHMSGSTENTVASKSTKSVIAGRNHKGKANAERVCCGAEFK